MQSPFAQSKQHIIFISIRITLLYYVTLLRFFYKFVCRSKLPVGISRYTTYVTRKIRETGEKDLYGVIAGIFRKSHAIQYKKKFCEEILKPVILTGW